MPRFGGGPPPWWPEGERWPPADDPGRARRRFARRIGCVVGLILLALAVGLALVGRFIVRSAGGDGSEPPTLLLGLLLIVLVVISIGRGVRRTALPIGEVMAAADRVAAGDYVVRVRPRGSREARRLAAAFNEMTARLQANEEQRRALLAEVAHELRTPLSVVRGAVEAMLDGVYPRDDAHLAPLLEETEVMARLLDDLRTLSLAEAGVLRLHREATDLDALVAAVVTAFEPRARERGVTLAAEGAATPELDVDPVRLRQVLDNLVANALRYTPAGGSIRIATASETDMVAVEVADTGPGIAEDALPHLFDRFAKSADSGGSGLGLAIAKRLVEAHGGAIMATSREGEGTTIRFTLPRASSEGATNER